MSVFGTSLLVLSGLIWLPTIAAADAVATFTETPLGNNVSQYQFTVTNAFDPVSQSGYSLYDIAFSFVGNPKVLLLPAGWDFLGSGSNVEAFSTFAGPQPTGSDIRAGGVETGFFFLADSNIPGASFVALFSNPIDPEAPLVQRGTVVSVPATAPVISTLTAAPNVIWPPNHKLVRVALNVSVSSSPAPAVCRISNVSSDEAITVPGETDWVVTGPLTLNVRAERSGSNRGRNYNVIVTCTNTANLGASKSVTISVPHDRKF